MAKFKFTPDKLMIGLFAAMLIAVPAVTMIMPKKEKSENENRTLAKFPELINKVDNSIDWDYITNREGKSFMDAYETYFSDHLVGRDLWVEGANAMSRLMGKQEINGVYTIDGQMIQAFHGYDEKEVEGSLSAMDKFAAKFPDKQMYFMLVPTSQEMYKNKLPYYADLCDEKAFVSECYDKLNNISCIDTLGYLSGHKDEYLYYRTDHHWTSLGAYYAYASAAKALGYSAHGLGEFNVETASSDFRGTLYSKTLDSGVQPDVMDFYFLANGEPKIKMRCNDGKQIDEYDSLYVREFLDVKDKYSSFTGSNVPIVDIETDVGNGKGLLVIKDSYAHALAPFLSKHYSKITMIDMRYINAGLQNFINLDDYDQVLFMQNVITFAEDSYLKKLVLTK